MYVGPAAHFSQTCTSAMTVPPPSYMLPQHHQPSPQPTSAAPPPPRAPHDDKDQKNNALLILKMLCETPLLQAYLLDLLKARSVLTLLSLHASSAVHGNIKVPVRMSCTSTEAVCRELMCHYTAPVHAVMINRVSDVPGHSVTIFMSASVACILTVFCGGCKMKS